MPASRRTVLGLGAVTGLGVLAACAGAPSTAPTSPSPTSAAPSPRPLTVPSSSPTVPAGATGATAAGATPTPTAAAAASAGVVARPSREELVARYEGRAPAWFELEGPGIVGRTGAAGVCLTLDACGGAHGSGVDMGIVELLTSLDVPATVFLNSRWVEANGELALRLAERARAGRLEIGNHGTAHRPLSVTGAAAYKIPGTGSVGEVYDEVMGNQVLLRERLGVEAAWFRPGTAYWDDVALAVATDLGLGAAGFSVNGDGGATLPAQVVSREVRGAGTGDVVICHMNQPRAGTGAGLADALPRMLEAGTAFLTLSQATTA